MPPETTSGPLLAEEFPLLLYVGAGAEAVTGRFFRSKSEGTSDGGGLGGRWAGVPHFAIESRGAVGTRLGIIAGAESMVRLGAGSGYPFHCCWTPDCMLPYDCIVCWPLFG